MAADPKEHRRRMLEHLARAAAAPRSEQAPDPQLKIPLIGEVRRGTRPASRRGRRRVKSCDQPALGDL
jgi:hypothetical protein